MNDISNEDVEMIKKVLNENIDENMEEYKYFHIGNFVEVPNQCGCFKRKDNWYTYENDEKISVQFLVHLVCEELYMHVQ